MYMFQYIFDCACTFHPGAWTTMRHFAVDQIKFCSMHALNLGFVLWVLGGGIVLLADERYIWGGPEKSRVERFHLAYSEFKQWASDRKIMFLDFGGMLVDTHGHGLLLSVLSPNALRHSQPKFRPSSFVGQSEFVEFRAKAWNAPW